jgi:nucleotide-binding universal stress UspA family protein
LVPLDGSRFAMEAVEAVLTLFAGEDVHFVLVRAVEPLDVVGGRPGCQYMRLSTEQALVEAERYLAHQRAALLAAGVTVETHVRLGAPALAVAAAAREADVHLIAAATHGTGGIAGTITGSTVARIVQQTHGPVLLVRPAWLRYTVPIHTGPPPLEAEVEELPVTVGFTATELDYVRRGLERLLGEIRPDEPLYRLLARVRRARAAHETERERRHEVAA